MRAWRLLFLAFLAALAWFVLHDLLTFARPAHAYTVSPFSSSHANAPPSQVLEGLDWDDRMWTPMPMPQDMVMCRFDSTANTVRCWAVPDGTVLMIPVPQADPQNH